MARLGGEQGATPTREYAMIGATSSVVTAASIAAAVMIAGVALFQLALAAGLPLGGAVFGGKAPTEDGVLTPPFRVLAVVQAAVLVAFGGVFLAAAGLVALLPEASLGWLLWVMVAFLVVNTLGNLSAPHPVERWVMGPTTLVLAVLGTVVALGR